MKHMARMEFWPHSGVALQPSKTRQAQGRISGLDLSIRTMSLGEKDEVQVLDGIDCRKMLAGLKTPQTAPNAQGQVTR